MVGYHEAHNGKEISVDELISQLMESKCDACGFRIADAPPNADSHEHCCHTYNHAAMSSNLHDQIRNIRSLPFRKAEPEIVKGEDGQCYLTFTLGPYPDEYAARTAGAFARKDDDWHVVTGRIEHQQANGYGRTWT